MREMLQKSKKTPCISGIFILYLFGMKIAATVRRMEAGVIE